MRNPSLLLVTSSAAKGEKPRCEGKRSALRGGLSTFTARTGVEGDIGRRTGLPCPYLDEEEGTAKFFKPSPSLSRNRNGGTGSAPAAAAGETEAVLLSEAERA